MVGAGGHAKIVAEAAELQGSYEVAGYVESDPSRVGASNLAWTVIASDDAILGEPSRYAEAFVVAVGGAKANPVRARIFDTYARSGLDPAGGPLVLMARHLTRRAGGLHQRRAIVGREL